MINNWKSLALVGLVSSAATIGGVKLLGIGETRDVFLNEAASNQAMRLTSGDPMGGGAPLPAGVPGDFVYAADVSTPAVVHIKNTAGRSSRSGGGNMGGMDIFRDFFGGEDPFRQGQQGPQESAGSGVIISSDGYIVTNNHVIEGAEELEVTLHDKRKLKAKLIGTDPSTDIAVIQIQATGLPTLAFGNSDAIKVGEWVVAVGNPFNLESTVTAGIVSAKGRGIGILNENFRQQKRNGRTADTPLESFIQTDAVVNPGNSGGALVNLRGELIGINTAIASPTGSFAGYAFAVPASIVKKVSSDILKFGNVQRGYIGIEPDELDSKKADEYGVKVNTGVYVRAFGSDGSAAKEAGVKVGDVIVKVDGENIESSPKFRELIGRKRPGESVNLTVNRDGSIKEFKVVLRNLKGGSEIVKADDTEAAMASLGGQFSDLNQREKNTLANARIGGGVKVTEVEGGKLARYGVEPGFVITKVNDKPVKSIKELREALAGKSQAQIEGLYPEYPGDIYSFRVNF